MKSNEDFWWQCSRCNAVVWVPNAEGLFVAGHADGNVYVYDKVSSMKISVLFLANLDCTCLKCSLFLDIQVIVLFGFLSYRTTGCHIW